MNALCKVFFEPVGYCALIGIIIWIYYAFRRKKVEMILMLLFFTVMFSWRPFTAVQSSRYYVILILPVILFCVYFCYSPQLWKTRFKWEKKNAVLLSAILFGILFLACLGKTLHFNLYEGSFRKGCAIMKADAKNYKKPKFISFADYQLKINYYSGISDHNAIPEADLPRLVRNIGKMIRGNSKNDVFYFYLSQSVESPCFSAEMMALKPGTLHCLYSGFVNNKKKKEWRLYRYRPVSSGKSIRKNPPLPSAG